MRRRLPLLRRLLNPIAGELSYHPEHPQLLIAHFYGVLRDGGWGNKQVEFMQEMLCAAFKENEYNSLILDLSEVKYTFGNHIWGLLSLLKDFLKVRVAVVISPLCEELGWYAEKIEQMATCRSRDEAMASLFPGPMTTR